MMTLNDWSVLIHTVCQSYLRSSSRRSPNRETCSCGSCRVAFQSVSFQVIVSLSPCLDHTTSKEVSSNMEFLLIQYFLTRLAPGIKGLSKELPRRSNTSHLSSEFVILSGPLPSRMRRIAPLLIPRHETRELRYHSNKLADTWWINQLNGSSVQQSTFPVFRFDFSWWLLQ